MNASKDAWKIRFGQIFQYYLNKKGKYLADYFYLLMEDQEIDPLSEKAFNIIDLKRNQELYDRYFKNNIPPVKDLNTAMIQRLNATVVIVPGFGQHLLKVKAFQNQIPMLKELGCNVIYTRFSDSFESNSKCASKVYEIIKTKEEPFSEQPLIFFTYSKGTPIVMKLLSDPEYADLTQRTKAVISFAGVIRGTPMASTKSACSAKQVLKIFRKHKEKIMYPHRIIRGMVSFFARSKISFFKDWLELIKKADDFADDIADLPEGIEDLTKEKSRKDFKNLRLPDHITLFSLSAVYPEKEIKKMKNPDDFFLYASGKDLYKKNVCNDLQLLLPDSQFYKNNGKIFNLGIVKAHHWGFAMRYVLSSKYIHKFPRSALIKAVLTLLDEFYNTVP